jgi:acyl dehydratase
MTEIDGYEVLGLGLYFEELPVGRKFRTIGRTLTEADLVAFIGVAGMTEVLFSNTEFLRTESDIGSASFPPRWSIPSPRDCWCTPRCSTRVSPS